MIIMVMIFFSSCETDLEVNAPWKDVTVVYGLLNQAEDTHYVKINKSFLGPADANAMAAIRDSSEYKYIHAWVEEWVGATKKREWTLQEMVITNKESGDFYYPDQKVYYFTDANPVVGSNGPLDGKAKYYLNIDVQLDDYYGYDTTKKVTAVTELVDEINDVNGGNSINVPSGLGFASANKYNDLIFEWLSAKDGKRYQLSMTFYYFEIKLDGSGDTLPAEKKSFEWVFQPVKSTSTNGSQVMNITISGEDFYKQIQQNVPVDDKVVKRYIGDTDFNGKPDCIQFHLVVAADDFNTYLEANEPSTGIIQEKPEYTNIVNGVGIFSARYKAESGLKGLSNESLSELYSGDIGKYTGELKFCSTSPVSAFYCGN